MSKPLRIALLGNPNTGKTSLFNALTGLRQKVGNFPGITVDKSVGSLRLKNGQIAELIDLPGTYSLFAKSADEAIPLQIVLDPKHPEYPDLVLFIADASNLKRNLLLLTQLIDLKLPIVLVLNMVDQAKAKGISLDIERLSHELEVPVVGVNARKKQGIENVVAAIEQGGKVSSKSFVQEGKLELIPFAEILETVEATDYQAVLSLHHSINFIPKKLQRIKPLKSGRLHESFDFGHFQREDLLYRYKHISEILNACIKQDGTVSFKRRQDRLDKVLTHPVFGFAIFLFILFIIFQSVFSLAVYPMEWIEGAFTWINEGIERTLPPGVLNDLITNGIMAGLSGVVVFIPQIAFLFFFISILEDTGYLARVAFMMDRHMRRFGLNGKSVIPLMGGTACAVPAIMAARNIENAKSRLITILVTPLMSCSARLPVYILLVGLVVPEKALFGFLGYQGLAMMGLYLLGFFAALGAAALYNLVIKAKARQYFILELPVYRMPNWTNVGTSVVNRVRSFVSEAGKIIIAISIVLWFLASYGPPKEQAAVAGSPTADAGIVEKAESMQAESLESSFAGIIGRSIEPAIEPLGYDWKIGISLITSFAAREVFVGTMATLYGLEGDEPDFSKLKDNMLASRDEDGNRIYTFATVVSLLLFYVFALQCISTIATTYKETASLKWTSVQLIFMTALAYLSALAAYQLLS